MRSSCPAEAGVVYPSVFVVDGQAGYPPPPSPYRRRAGTAQWPLYLLLSLALCGMIVEACFIYHLYSSIRPPSDVGQTAKIAQGRDETENLPKRSNKVEPSKPTAHLTVGPHQPRDDGILLWNPAGDSITHELDYRDGGLHVQTEGYYFVYSKVFFTEPNCDMFTHTVLRRTSRYLGPALQLMESRRFHCHRGSKDKELLNSYLGGVYHLVKGDIILVRAENNTLIARQGSYDNFFGAYMI